MTEEDRKNRVLAASLLRPTREWDWAREHVERLEDAGLLAEFERVRAEVASVCALLEEAVEGDVEDVEVCKGPTRASQYEARDVWLIRADAALFAHDVFGDRECWAEAEQLCVGVALCSITSDTAWERAHGRGDA